MKLTLSLFISVALLSGLLGVAAAQSVGVPPDDGTGSLPVLTETELDKLDDNLKLWLGGMDAVLLGLLVQRSSDPSAPEAVSVVIRYPSVDFFDVRFGYVTRTELISLIGDSAVVAVEANSRIEAHDKISAQLVRWLAGESANDLGLIYDGEAGPDERVAVWVDLDHWASDAEIDYFWHELSVDLYDGFSGSGRLTRTELSALILDDRVVGVSQVGRSYLFGPPASGTVAANSRAVACHQ